jgi:hypothetical protein
VIAAAIGIPQRSRSGRSESWLQRTRLQWERTDAIGTQEANSRAAVGLLTETVLKHVCVAPPVTLSGLQTLFRQSVTSRPCATACRIIHSRRNRPSACHRPDPRSLRRRPVGMELRGWPVPFVKRRRAGTSSVRSICRKPLFFNANAQTKAFVAPGRDLITFLLVCGDPADIRHEYTGFPWDIGADVP